MIGVNGVGKTTTLGKLAAQHTRAGRKVLLVAGDTFRAAATEQLDVWARRVGCAIHTGADKADPSSVIFEGITRGRREGFDVVLCDTAGRLHTRKELMDELAKVGRAAAKAIAKGLPAGTVEDGAEAATLTGAHDTFLVLDATIGQNALAQAQLFKETMGFSGLVVTKLDGTAKGGVVLGICDELRVPIRYVGIGEGIEDLRAFDAQDFVDALLADRERAEAPADATP
jgi:fused signal recognition particle receptor